MVRFVRASAVAGAFFIAVAGNWAETEPLLSLGVDAVLLKGPSGGVISPLTQALDRRVKGDSARDAGGGPRSVMVMTCRQHVATTWGG